MVFKARSAGISCSIASTTPQRMPMSRFPLSDWLGSSTSPPLITRSNLSFGPMAALALADSANAATEPVSSRKCRRDNADMRLPRNDFLFAQDAPGAGFAQAADQARRRIAYPNRNANLSPVGWLKRSVKLERAFRPAGAGNPFCSDACASRIRGNRGPDHARLGTDRNLVAGLFAAPRHRQDCGV